MIKIVPFFEDAEEAFINSVITRLSFEVFLPGDYIVRQGSFGSKMYFIQQGMVDIIAPNGRVATTLHDGSYFGGVFCMYLCTYVFVYVIIMYVYKYACMYACTYVCVHVCMYMYVQIVHVCMYLRILYIQYIYVLV